MAIVAPDKLDAFLAVTAKWDVETSVLGEVTGDGRLVIHWHGEEIVNVDPSTVAVDGPVYERPVAYPDWIDALRDDSASALPRTDDPDTLRAQFTQLLSSPNLADTSWVTNQYDYYVMGNTALAFPDDAGMIRVDEESGLGFAIATDCNGRFCQLDPYEGAKLALAEAYRNVAVTGAMPTAVTDCLNFGSPENPDVMWQFKRAVEGLSDGCLELEIPVTGGNVSFYNQTGDTPIFPTPVVGVLGIIDDVARRVPSGWQDAGENIYLLGVTSTELSGSAWAGTVHGHLGGRPPKVDLAAEKRLAELLRAGAEQSLISSAHDLSAGGLGQALAEGVLRFGVGARVWLREIMERDGVDAASALFSESTGRVIVTVPREDDVKFRGPLRRPRLPGAAHRRDRHPAVGRERARGAGPVHGAALRAARTVDRDAAGRLRRDRVRAVADPRLRRVMDEDEAVYSDARQKRIRVVAWVVIVSLVLVGGGATVFALLFG